MGEFPFIISMNPPRSGTCLDWSHERGVMQKEVWIGLNELCRVFITHAGSCLYYKLYSN